MDRGWFWDGSRRPWVHTLLPTAPMGTAAVLSWHGTALHGTARDAQRGPAATREAHPGRTHVLSSARSCPATAPAADSPGQDRMCLLPRKLRHGPPRTVPQPGSVSRSPPVGSRRVPSSCVPAGAVPGRGTDLCRCRGCSSSFWKQTKQKESIAQLRWPPRPGEGDRRAGSAGGVLASSSPEPAVA